MRRLPAKLSITVVSSASLALDAPPESFSPMVRQSSPLCPAKLTPVTPSFAQLLAGLPLFLQAIKRQPNLYYHSLSQFSRLGRQRTKHATAAGQRNMSKNRYVDILPSDHSRVILLGSDNDYINASHVKLFERQYILAQAPIHQTVGDFWTMLWQQKAEIVVNLTRNVEGGRQKCIQYWPAASLEICGLFVELVDQVDDGDIIKRVFYVTLADDVDGDGESLTIVMLHYLGWQDCGVPADPRPVLQLMQMAGYERRRSMHRGPVVVHCSAGIGRAGCYAVADAVNHKLSDDPTAWESEADLVQAAIATARTSRRGVVQTAVQFTFCYELVETFCVRHGKPDRIPEMTISTTGTDDAVSVVSASDGDDSDEGDEGVVEEGILNWSANLLQRIRSLAWSP